MDSTSCISKIFYKIQIIYSGKSTVDCKLDGASFSLLSFSTCGMADHALFWCCNLKSFDSIYYGIVVLTCIVCFEGGGFQANVFVKGMDFEYSSCGEPCSDPREARESAATKMLGQLWRMASLAK